jgi:23S rRNA pseudouridine2605 synthase
VTEETSPGERIAKYLARAGIASRREVERMIEGGRVKVNGKLLDTPAFKVTGSEHIEVDGKRVEAAQATKLWRYHKPPGLVTTHSDPEGRETVFEKMPRDIGRVISIGRLDLTSEGLLLMTNDGGLARALELPSTGWTRKYRVRAWGKIDAKAIAELKAGITVDGVKYGPILVEVERDSGTNVWLNVDLKEGKNREIRKVLEACGLAVNRLIRTAYGPFQLGQLALGEVKSVPPRILKDQCGHLLGSDTVFEDPETLDRASTRPNSRAKAGSKSGKPGFKRGKPERDDSKRGTSSSDDRKPGDRKPSGGARSGSSRSQTNRPSSGSRGSRGPRR